MTILWLRWVRRNISAKWDAKDYKSSARIASESTESFLAVCMLPVQSSSIKDLPIEILRTGVG
ncbi:hypothetical protein TWF718_008419 [Orbilia javanica]|uniref:Uncharacterized protein n=1 Tax=Orbilia javanica TaxID=47235 RepID=A0AAN8MWX5_9PEZI